jgi:hypothetical protein
MTHWSDIYPHTLYASVSLIDNKITGWKVSDRIMDIDSNHYGGGKIKNAKFIVDNLEEHNDVFSKYAPRWFSIWELADNFRGFKPY